MGAIGAAPLVARAGVVAACSDGAIILAKKWEDVNCSGAVEVAPDDVPPIGSGKRPRPIAWANFLREQEELRRAMQSPPRDAPRATHRKPAASTPRGRPVDHPRSARSPSASSKPSIALTGSERRDLALLVELSQRKIPAILKHTRAGERTAALRVAHSRAFEAKLHAHQRAAGDLRFAPVLVFSVEPADADLRATPLFFAQGGPGFSPNVGDPRDFGWIDRGAARPGAENRRLGYVVLPESFELSRPIAIFWGDSVVATTLRR